MLTFFGNKFSRALISYGNKFGQLPSSSISEDDVDMAEPSLASVMTMIAKVLEKVEKRDTERETRASTERQE